MRPNERSAAFDYADHASLVVGLVQDRVMPLRAIVCRVFPALCEAERIDHPDGETDCTRLEPELDGVPVKVEELLHGLSALGFKTKRGGVDGLLTIRV
jgi:hypothetical protein